MRSQWQGTQERWQVGRLGFGGRSVRFHGSGSKCHVSSGKRQVLKVLSAKCQWYSVRMSFQNSGMPSRKKNSDMVYSWQVFPFDLAWSFFLSSVRMMEWIQAFRVVNFKHKRSLCVSDSFCDAVFLHVQILR